MSLCGALGACCVVFLWVAFGGVPSVYISSYWSILGAGPGVPRAAVCAACSSGPAAGGGDENEEKAKAN